MLENVGALISIFLGVLCENLCEPLRLDKSYRNIYRRGKPEVSAEGGEFFNIGHYQMMTSRQRRVRIPNL